MSQINIWQATKMGMTIVGTTIGAGFASGREIWEFFGSYGEESYVGILLAMVLFFAVSVIILIISWRNQTENYSELLSLLMGKSIKKIFDILVFIYLLTTTIVMIAASGATFEQWDLSFWRGSIVMIVAVFIVLCFDLKGLISLNMFIMPLLIFGLLFVCIQFLQNPQYHMNWEHSSEELPVWHSAIIYSAFNIMSLVAVLSTMGKEIKHVGEVWWACIISVISLGIVALLYNQSLLKIEPLISQYDIPLFALVQNYSPLFLFLITCVLWLAIYTTTVSNLHGMVFRLSNQCPLPRWLISLIILLILSPLSQFGFSTLVQVLYPLYGVLNLFLLAIILLYPFVR